MLLIKKNQCMALWYNSASLYLQKHTLKESETETVEAYTLLVHSFFMYQIYSSNVMYVSIQTHLEKI